MAAPLAHPRLAEWLGDELSYSTVAAIMLLAASAAAAAWPAPPRESQSRSRVPAPLWMAIGCGAALVVAYATATHLLPIVFAGPLDVNRGDMLVVTDLGVRRVLEGHTPYTMYRVPWEMTLSYGPGLWAPFVLPVLLHADLRVMTLIGLVSVAAALVIVSARAAACGDRLGAIAGAVLTIALVAHPDVRAFYPTGHTFVYWPLLVLFCALLAADRWTAAAAVLGCLVCARSTMAALVPVFLIAA